MRGRQGHAEGAKRTGTAGSRQDREKHETQRDIQVCYDGNMDKRTSESEAT